MYVLIQGDLLSRGFGPYVDYYSIHGPFPFLFSAAAMHFYGVSLHAIVLNQIMGAMLFGVLMFKVAVSRLHPFWAILLAVFIELILVSCTPIGCRVWRDFTFAMWYNLIGYCIQAIVFLYLLVPSRSPNRASEWTDAVIIAFCLMASFLTKVSFFAPMALVFVFGALVYSRDRRMRVRAVFSLALAAVMATGLMSALGGSIASYLGFFDTLGFRVHPLMLSFKFVQYTRTIGVFVLGITLIAWFAYEAGLLNQVKRETILVLLMLGSFLVSASTSAQDHEILPMLGVVPLGLAALVASLARQQSKPINQYLITATLGTAFLLLVHTPKDSVISLAFSHSPSVPTLLPTLAKPLKEPLDDEIAMHALGLSDRVDSTLLTMMPKVWTASQVAAISLLREASYAKEGKLFVATKTSPINMLLDAEYPKGQMPYWLTEFITKPELFPLAEDRLLEDADWILRDVSADGFWRYLVFHRGEILARDFELIAENERWMLYRRIIR